MERMALKYLSLRSRFRMKGNRILPLCAIIFAIVFHSSANADPIYWNVFNIEGESTVSADFVTYASLTDMLSDTNRTGVSTVGGIFGHNIVGSGAFVNDVVDVPEPAAFGLFILGLMNLGLATRLHKTY